MPADAPANPLGTGETSGATVAETEVNHLELLGRWHKGPVFDSAVAGGHVFLGSGGNIQVMKIEAGSPNSPPQWTEVATLETPGVVHGLDANGDHLYVADDSGALRVVDISKPESPSEIGHVELPHFVRAVFCGRATHQALSMAFCRSIYACRLAGCNRGRRR